MYSWNLTTHNDSYSFFIIMKNNRKVKRKETDSINFIYKIKNLPQNSSDFAASLPWCRRRDLNPHGQGPLPPQDSVSANSTTPATATVKIIAGK